VLKRDAKITLLARPAGDHPCSTATEPLRFADPGDANFLPSACPESSLTATTTQGESHVQPAFSQRAVPTEEAMTSAAAASEPLNSLVGNWTTEATHPALPGVVVHGTVTSEWLEGEQFLIQRARTDHPDFPDSISIIGFVEQDRIDDAHGPAAAASGKRQLSMHYYDSRGVFRAYQTSIDGEAWQFWRDAPGFSQRFTGTFADGGNTIVGRSQLREDDVHWKDDLQITYRRRE